MFNDNRHIADDFLIKIIQIVYTVRIILFSISKASTIFVHCKLQILWMRGTVALGHVDPNFTYSYISVATKKTTRQKSLQEPRLTTKER